MNTEALEYFLKVYEKKSVTAAAKELYITPQGISKTIKHLELELESELFSRGPRGMEATQAGELLYARAKHILYLMEDIKKEISIIGGKKGILNVVLTYSTSALLPVDYLYRFSELHSDIGIKLREFPDDYPMGKLFDEDVDVGLVMQPDDLESCDYEPIATGELVAVVRRSHPLAEKNVISVDDLENEPLVLHSIGNDKENSFLVKCLEHGFTPNVIHEFGNMISAQRLCKLNGSVIVSIDIVEEAFRDDELKMIRFSEKMAQSFYLAVRKRGSQSRAIALFQSYVKEGLKPV